MPAFALPWAVPAVGEGLLWGAGALGTGLTALGIIENKDAIRDGISSFGNWISNGVLNGIRSWSLAMSPKGAIVNPNYDVVTGRPIAVADATRVEMPLLRQLIQSGPYGTTRSARYDYGEPIFFPWLAGSSEKPILLRPVTITGSRVMRTDAGGAQPAQSTSISGSGSTAAPAPANPDPLQDQEQDNSRNSDNLRRPSFRERLGDRIAGRNGRQTTSGGTTPSPNNNQNGSFLGRMLWETKNNNFGQNWWQWRNVGRVGLGLSYPAREHLWPAVGQGVKYMTVGPDSVPATTTPPVAPAAPTQILVDSSYVAKDQYIAPTDTLDF